MIELLDTDKLKTEEYIQINEELRKTIGEMSTVLNQTITMGEHYSLDYAFIISHINEFENKVFLDLGSGLSILPVWLAKQGAFVMAIDQLDKKAPYDKLRKKLKIPLTFLKSDFLRDPLPSADVIVSCSSIEHNPYNTGQELVKNLARTLIEGGQLIFTVVAEPIPRVYEYKHYPYNEDRIRHLFLDEFKLEEENSNFSDFENLYAKFRQTFPHLWYMPLGVSLIRENGKT